MVLENKNQMDERSTMMPPDTGIGFAVRHLWMGFKLFRKGWNGKGMYLQMQIPDRGSKMSLPYVYMRTADNHLVPWICSQSDLLGNDWEIFK
jgi:hypothetical protein